MGITHFPYLYFIHTLFFCFHFFISRKVLSMFLCSRDFLDLKILFAAAGRFEEGLWRWVMRAEELSRGFLFSRSWGQVHKWVKWERMSGRKKGAVDSSFLWCETGYCQNLTWLMKYSELLSFVARFSVSHILTAVLPRAHEYWLYSVNLL